MCQIHPGGLSWRNMEQNLQYDERMTNVECSKQLKQYAWGETILTHSGKPLSCFYVSSQVENCKRNPLEQGHWKCGPCGHGIDGIDVTLEIVRNPSQKCKVSCLFILTESLGRTAFQESVSQQALEWRVCCWKRGCVQGTMRWMSIHLQERCIWDFGDIVAVGGWTTYFKGVMSSSKSSRVPVCRAQLLHSSVCMLTEKLWR